MYGGLGFEALASGLGTGAFSVLLLRITQKRFSATQYALFSSLFGLPRIVAGPICGFLVDAVGWTAFFWFAIAAGLPGLLLLARFVPFGAREPELRLETPAASGARPPLSAAGLALRGLAGGLLGLALAACTAALLAALKAMHPATGRGLTPAPAGRPFDLWTPLAALFSPADLNAWLTLAGVLACALVAGLLAASVAAARRGQGADLAAQADLA